MIEFLVYIKTVITILVRASVVIIFETAAELKKIIEKIKTRTRIYSNKIISYRPPKVI